MGKRITKSDIRRQEVADGIARRRDAISNKIAEWQAKLDDLQAGCPHYNSWYENKGSTGSWDRDDTFWRDYECEDCGRIWTTDQGIAQDRKYPHSIRGTKRSGEWEPYRY